MAKKGLIMIIAGCVVVAGVAAVYFVGRNYYSTHLYAGTYVNGIDCSNYTVDEAKDEVQMELETYALTVKERGDLEDTVTGKDLEFVYKDNGEIQTLLDGQNVNLWFTELPGTKDYEISSDFTYSDDKLSSLVADFQCFQEKNLVKPTNAEVILGNDGFEIQPETEGSYLEKKDVEEQVKEAISGNKKEVDLDAAGVYEEPEVRSDNAELKSSMDSLNQMISAQITYDFVDRQYTVGKEQLKSWLVQAEDGTWSIDQNQVSEWVRNMAYETDTFGLSREFTTSTGKTITLEGGGDYGWCIDKEDTLAQLMEYINTGAQLTTEPEYLYTAEDRSKNDIGGSYVEVCISTQTLWCYYEGQLITTTPVITGCVNKGYSTPSGSVWAIDAEKTNWNFTNFPNAWSDYWMPFNDQCGLHDASWQAESNYTPTYYIDSGSHGCVNIPLASMEQIYNHMHIGSPVVVYYSEDQVVGPSPTEELVSG